MAALAEIPKIGELDRLRSDNARLRQRLDAAESIARERQGRIEDLLAALRMLPAAWAERMRLVAEGRAGVEAPFEDDDVVEAVWEESAPAIKAQPPMEDLPDPDEMARARTAWAEARRVRDRLERDHLERARQRLRGRKGRRRAKAWAVRSRP